MKLVGEFDYRNTKAILHATAPQELAEIYEVLSNVESVLQLAVGEKSRQLSSQVKKWFAARGWKEEQPAFALRRNPIQQSKSSRFLPMARRSKLYGLTCCY